MNFGVDPLPEENAVTIDLTSMIDVLFVLVLFFMVTTTFSDTSSIPVSLPAASKGSVQPAKKDLAVSITQSGDIFLSTDGSAGKPVTLDALTAQFSELKQTGTDLTLIVRADKHAEHGAVVAVMDRAKSSGIDRIAIAADVAAMQ
ncbi:MAG: biopolymer transporter ExbD [Bdellovibrionota bacterium]